MAALCVPEGLLMGAGYRGYLCRCKQRLPPGPPWDFRAFRLMKLLASTWSREDYKTSFFAISFGRHYQKHLAQTGRAWPRPLCRRSLQTHPTLLHPALPQRLVSKDHLNAGSYGEWGMGKEVRGQDSTCPFLASPSLACFSLPTATDSCPWPVLSKVSPLRLF